MYKKECVGGQKTDVALKEMKPNEEPSTGVDMNNVASSEKSHAFKMALRHVEHFQVAIGGLVLQG